MRSSNRSWPVHKADLQPATRTNLYLMLSNYILIQLNNEHIYLYPQSKPYKQHQTLLTGV